MPSSNKAKIGAILLALAFLAAQFHFCADLSAGNVNGHFCPFCSSAGAAIAPYVPILEMAPVAARLEVHATEAAASTGIALSISPRAPPHSVILG